MLYETGLAHALDKDLVTIVQNEQDVPFDLRHMRFLKYLRNNEGLKQPEDAAARVTTGGLDTAGYMRYCQIFWISRRRERM